MDLTRAASADQKRHDADIGTFAKQALNKRQFDFKPVLKLVRIIKHLDLRQRQGRLKGGKVTAHRAKRGGKAIGPGQCNPLKRHAMCRANDQNALDLPRKGAQGGKAQCGNRARKHQTGMGHNDCLGDVLVLCHIGMQGSINQPVNLASKNVGISRIKSSWQAMMVWSIQVFL